MTKTAKTTKLKTTKTEWHSSSCDICAIEFPHARPNAAEHDGVLPGYGWVYACAAHASRIVPHVR